MKWIETEEVHQIHSVSWYFMVYLKEWVCRFAILEKVNEIYGRHTQTESVRSIIYNSSIGIRTIDQFWKNVDRQTHTHTHTKPKQWAKKSMRIQAFVYCCITPVKINYVWANRKEIHILSFTKTTTLHISLLICPFHTPFLLSLSLRLIISLGKKNRKKPLRRQ